MPTWGQYYWPIAMVVAFGLMFGIPELYALFTNTANTLSWYAWRMLNIGISKGNGIHTLAWWTSLIVWWLFVLAITLHIWYKSW